MAATKATPAPLSPDLAGTVAPYGVHPSVTDLLRFFSYAHLPEHLRWVSQPFHDLAHDAAHNFGLAGAELTVGLRKLLEAKDAIVRAAV